MVQWTTPLCPPTVNRFEGETPSCSTRRADVMSRLTRLKPDTVVLAGAWELYLKAGRSQDETLRALSQTIRYLRNLGDEKIVVFGPGPLWNTSLSIDLFRFMARKRLSEIPERLGRVSDEIWALDAAMAAQAAAEGVRYVSVVRYFCSESGCLTIGDRALARPDLLYRDSNHLTATGSKALISHSIPQLLGQN
ncbi:MAG TPA: SGNH hydrolase domain-containing protein [Steroidobacteraceae bacterium]